MALLSSLMPTTTDLSGNVVRLSGDQSISGNKTFSGTLLIAAGTVSAPSIAFSGDTNTGIYSPTGNQVSIVTRGDVALNINEVASAVNYLQITPSAIGNDVLIDAVGSDTNIDLAISPKAAGNIVLDGTTIFNDTIASSNAAGPAFLDAASSGTVPNILVNKADTNTGIGQSDVNRLSLIIGGNEEISILSGDTTINRVLTIGGGVNNQSYIELTFSGYTASIGGDATGMNIGHNSSSRAIMFQTGGTEKARVSGSGAFIAGSNNSTSTLSGHVVAMHSTSGATLAINRITNDGNLIDFYQASTHEGSISVSVNTVTYNNFCGAHASQLSDSDTQNKNLIPFGTVVSTIDELSEWWAAEWTDSDGTFYHELTNRKDMVGNTITHRGNETQRDHAALIIKETNERLARVKISDVIADKSVYGVFANVDDDGDIRIHALGSTRIRVTGPCSNGDLLESNGDGTARVQADDIIRSSTLGKVTVGKPFTGLTDENIVPCVLYCG